MKSESETITKTYCFTLRYLGVTELNRELEDALFEAGCDDALLGIQGGMIFLDFSRRASSFREALLSAIEDVEKAGMPIRLVRVEPV
jgi:hypothetical protein